MKMKWIPLSENKTRVINRRIQQENWNISIYINNESFLSRKFELIFIRSTEKWKVSCMTCKDAFHFWIKSEDTLHTLCSLRIYKYQPHFAYILTSPGRMSNLSPPNPKWEIQNLDLGCYCNLMGHTNLLEDLRYSKLLEIQLHLSVSSHSSW